MDHDEREHSGRDRSDAKRESQRASEHFKREILFGGTEKGNAGKPSKRITLGPTAPAQPLAPATERHTEPQRESGRELESRQARHLCKMMHVFENWHEMKLNVKLAALLAVDREIAILQRRPQLSGIVSYVGHPLSRGAFWPQENRLDFNRSVLRRRSPRVAIGSYLHEARHAYQFDVITRPSEHPEVSTARLLLWRSAALLYPQLSDNPTYLQRLAYALNPLEMDATAFANRMFRRIKKEMSHVF